MEILNNEIHFFLGGVRTVREQIFGHSTSELCRCKGEGLNSLRGQMGLT